MLEELHLKNFQSHKDSNLVFDKGVNIIIGSSDSGKSAILRALNSCVYGELPEAYRTWDTNETEVTITVDGKNVTRRRGKNSNEYQLGASYYKALNRTVPEDIVELFNMNDLNIQAQLDNPFLLSETSGEVAKRLNKAVNLDIIDNALRVANRLRTDTTSSYKHYKEQLNDYVEKVKKYDRVDEFGEFINSLSTFNKKVEELSTQHNMLETLIGKLRNNTLTKSDTKASLKNKNNILSKLENISNLYQAFTTIRNKNTTLSDKIENYKMSSTKLKNDKNKYKSISKVHTALCGLLTTYQTVVECRVSIDKLNTIITKHAQTKELLKVSMDRKITLDKILNKFNELLSIIEKGKNIKERRNELTNKLNQYNNHSNTINTTKEQRKDKEEELHRILPEICPLCGHKTK